MEQVTIVGLDLAKRVFQVHGATADGGIAIRKKLSRGQVLAFFADLPPCVVAMEACATAHYWAREIGALGHNVRLVPPAYVKPFVKRQKNDAADAEAIAEAASWPTMRFVEPKSPQQQARAMVFRTRELFVRQRTQTINALRAHLSILCSPQAVISVAVGNGLAGQLQRIRGGDCQGWWRLAVPGQDVQHDASGMNVARQRFGACGLYRLDPIGQHGAQDADHLPIASGLTLQLAPHAADRHPAAPVP